MNIKIIAVSMCALLSATGITSVNGCSNSLQDLSRDHVSSLFEKYDGGMTDGQTKERLDALALYLSENPTFRAYIISYGGRRSCRAETLTRAAFARRYLSKVKGAARNRITVIDGGFRAEWTVELWTGAIGALRPTPEPTLDRREVQIIRNCKLKISGPKNMVRKQPMLTTDIFGMAAGYRYDQGTKPFTRRSSRSH